ncbi:integrase, catalytic region, zinc finger, CCHC-type containing protein [Tanacetum coccineum]
MQSDVQHNYVVGSDADYTSDSNIISYDQYMEDNEEHVVQSNVSSVRNDALMSILNEMHEQGVQSMSVNKQDKVVNDSVTSELARYKELVGVYEQRAKFELTDRERKIDEQMRIIISDRNRKETSLKSELHSAQLQLRSTLNHHKIVREEAIILKKDFKQKEDKFLEEFLDIKRLKEKVEDRLYKQDQSVQTVHMICKPKSFYDEKNKVAIGYKNPLYLTRAKQVQPALYNGHVLVMSNHARPVVHDSEDTRDMAEITRKRMMEKMKSPLCVENKVRIAPPDYSKENLLATFAPQRNLTPEQIFWSIDENDRKKAETSVPKPLSALTVYPPNTPVKLVPRVLPTKSQVKINLYVLTQLFTEFDKTCKKRITPTGVTEGERGFEQTKRCYLTEVIPFFKTLKEHFAGVQTALFKEVKVMEEIFDQMNDEVDQNTVDKQCAEIVKKNLLIENENLIANCLSNQLLYDVEKSRCLDLEAEMSKVHNESKHISKLEREYLNLQLKYQHLQESFDNNKSQTSQEAPDFNSFFKIKNLEHQIQEKDNVIRDLKSRTRRVKQLTRKLFEIYSITRSATNEKTSSLLHSESKAQLEGKYEMPDRSRLNKVLAPDKKVALGKLNCGYQWRPTGKKFALVNCSLSLRFLVQCRYSVSPEYTTRGTWTQSISGGNFVILILKLPSESILALFVILMVQTYLKSLAQFVHEFEGYIVKSSPIAQLSKLPSQIMAVYRRLNHLNFGTINDLARKDLVRGLPRLKFEKDHLCSACQLGKSKKFSHKPKSENTNMKFFIPSHICGPMRVGLNKTVRYIRTDNGTEFVNQVMSKYYEGVGIFHQKSVPRTPQQNGVVERRNRTLVEAARTMMIFSKAPMFLWAEAVATAYAPSIRSYTVIPYKSSSSAFLKSCSWTNYRRHLNTQADLIPQLNPLQENLFCTSTSGDVKLDEYGDVTEKQSSVSCKDIAGGRYQSLEPTKKHLKQSNVAFGPKRKPLTLVFLVSEGQAMSLPAYQMRIMRDFKIREEERQSAQFLEIEFDFTVIKEAKKHDHLNNRGGKTLQLSG